VIAVTEWYTTAMVGVSLRKLQAMPVTGEFVGNKEKRQSLSGKTPLMITIVMIGGVAGNPATAAQRIPVYDPGSYCGSGLEIRYPELPLSGELSEQEWQQAYDDRSYAGQLAAQDPIAAFEWLKKPDNQSVKVAALAEVFRHWVKLNPGQMLEYVTDENFEPFMLLYGYESGLIFENALYEIEPRSAMAWITQNKLATCRNLTEQTFTSWLYTEAKAAITWYSNNEGKVQDKLLLDYLFLYSTHPSTFKKIFKSLSKPDQIRTVIDIVSRLEVGYGSAKTFIDTVEDNEVLEWANLTSETLNTVVDPEKLLDKTAIYFDDDMYQVLTYVCWNKVPESVRTWIDVTPHLDNASRINLHAMLDSRELSFKYQYHRKGR